MDDPNTPTQPTVVDAIEGINRNYHILLEMPRGHSQRRGVNTALLMWVMGWWDEIYPLLAEYLDTATPPPV